MNVDVKKIFQELIVPELKEIKSEQREFRSRFEVEIKRLDQKIDSLSNEMHSEFKRIDEKIDIAMDLRDRIVALETSVSILSSK